MSLLFELIWYFIGMILLKKSCQKLGVQKKEIKRGNGHIWGGGRLSMEGGGVNPSAHYM